MTVILGIDPGSRITGYGVTRFVNNQHHFIACGCIRMTETDIGLRLQQIHDGLATIIAEYNPAEAAVEQVFMHQNPGGAIKLGQARGAAIVTAATRLLTVAEYSARQVKQAVVGYGAATKEQVQHMICRLLNLSQSPQEDAADALAVAICHAHSRQGLAAIVGAKTISRGRIK